MIGERLKELRKNKEISQRQLAEILGVRKAAVSLYETDQCDPSDPVKITLVKYFDVSLDYLLGLTDHKVKCYSEDNFLIIPDNISGDEKRLMRDFFNFVTTRIRQE